MTKRRTPTAAKHELKKIAPTKIETIAPGALAIWRELYTPPSISQVEWAAIRTALPSFGVPVLVHVLATTEGGYELLGPPSAQLFLDCLRSDPSTEAAPIAAAVYSHLSLEDQARIATEVAAAEWIYFRAAQRPSKSGSKAHVAENQVATFLGLMLEHCGWNPRTRDIAAALLVCETTILKAIRALQEFVERNPEMMRARPLAWALFVGTKAGKLQAQLDRQASYAAAALAAAQSTQTAMPPSPPLTVTVEPDPTGTPAPAQVEAQHPGDLTDTCHANTSEQTSAHASRPSAERPPSEPPMESPRTNETELVPASQSLAPEAPPEALIDADGSDSPEGAQITTHAAHLAAAPGNEALAAEGDDRCEPVVTAPDAKCTGQPSAGPSEATCTPTCEPAVVAQDVPASTGSELSLIPEPSADSAALSTAPPEWGESQAQEDPAVGAALLTDQAAAPVHDPSGLVSTAHAIRSDERNDAVAANAAPITRLPDPITPGMSLVPYTAAIVADTLSPTPEHDSPLPARTSPNGEPEGDSAAAIEPGAGHGNLATDAGAETGLPLLHREVPIGSGGLPAQATSSSVSTDIAPVPPQGVPTGSCPAIPESA